MAETCGVGSESMCLGAQKQAQVLLPQREDAGCMRTQVQETEARPVVASTSRPRLWTDAMTPGVKNSKYTGASPKTGSNPTPLPKQ